MSNQSSIQEAVRFPWYAVRVRSNFEKKTATLLQQKGLEEFAPTYKSRRYWSDRVKVIERPLFPGYVFCRFDARNPLPVLQTAGVVHVVSFGGDPVAVDDAEIESVRAMVDSALPLFPHAFLRLGERVRVKRGPLSGVEGILERFEKGCRTVVSVSLLTRSVEAE